MLNPHAICADARESFRNKTGMGVVARYLCRVLEDEYGVKCLPADYRARTLPRSLERSRAERLSNLLRHLVWKQLYLPWVMVREQARVLLCPDPVSPLLAPGRIVIVVHDLMFFRYPQDVNRWWGRYWRLMLPLAVRRANRIVVVSESTKKQLVELLGVNPIKIVVAPEGYDAEVFRPIPPADARAELARYALPSRFVLFVGAVEARRNIETLLRAAARLQNEAGLVLPVVIAGALTAHVQSLWQLAEELQLQSVKWLGYVPDEDLARLYSAADVYVYPSIAEGFGLTVLEAMACGCPVICSNVDSLPEVAGEACILLAPHDVDGFADAMRRVWTQPPLAAELRTRGLERAAKFSWTSMAETVIQVCRQVS